MTELTNTTMQLSCKLATMDQSMKWPVTVFVPEVQLSAGTCFSLFDDAFIQSVDQPVPFPDYCRLFPQCKEPGARDWPRFYIYSLHWFSWELYTHSHSTPVSCADKKSKELYLLCLHLASHVCSVECVMCRASHGWHFHFDSFGISQLCTWF